MTSVDTVFRKFLSMIEDKEWAYSEEDIILDLMDNYLDSSLVDFTKCKNKITIIDDTFNRELTNEEILILATGMVCHYLEPKILREESMKQTITSSDYKSLSGANMLDKLLKLKEEKRKDFERRQRKYEFNNFKGFV